MPKYGLFLPGESKPALEFEGDRLSCNAAGIVEIYRTDPAGNNTTAVIRLAEGQSVKEITERRPSVPGRSSSR